MRESQARIKSLASFRGTTVNPSLRFGEISRRSAGVVCVACLLLAHAFAQSENSGTTRPPAPPAGATSAAKVADGANPVAAPLKSKVNPKDGLTYVWIPPGKFQMGCSPDDRNCNPSEFPVHSVTLTTGFWMSQTPVTEKAYMKVVGSNPSTYMGAQLPVENIAWGDAQSYCQAVGMRLPTEAEWEYAARGRSPNQRYGPLEGIAWYDSRGNSIGGDNPHPVAQKQPNAYGLYDMLGNVQEWVADWNGRYASAPEVDPKGPPVDEDPQYSSDHRVVRGTPSGYDAIYVTASRRDFASPSSPTPDIGFRCVGD